jgi:hypothetical protein
MQAPGRERGRGNVAAFKPISDTETSIIFDRFISRFQTRFCPDANAFSSEVPNAVFVPKASGNFTGFCARFRYVNRAGKNNI